MRLLLHSKLRRNPVTLQRLPATRRLSYQQFVLNVKTSYRVIMLHLQKQVDYRKNAKAKGILQSIRQWKFKYILENLSMILQTLASLSRAFSLLIPIYCMETKLGQHSSMFRSVSPCLTSFYGATKLEMPCLVTATC